MRKEIILVPIDAGLLLTKLFVTGLFSIVGLIIYVAGGLTIIVAGACVLCGLVTGDGVYQLLIGSTKLLLIIAGASAAVLVLRKVLLALKKRIGAEEE